MQLNLKWEKKIISNLYLIYQNDKLIGNINKDIFSLKYNGELNGRSFLFIRKGFLNQQVLIIEQSNQRIVGEISLGSWLTKASILINNNTYNWKCKNFWSAKWSISDFKETQIQYSKSLSKGEIYSNTNNELLLLSGLYIAIYYRQQSLLIILIALIPLWITAINS